MDTYEAPQITELGTTADFTRGDTVDFDFDGALFHRNNGGGGGGS